MLREMRAKLRVAPPALRLLTASSMFEGARFEARLCAAGRTYEATHRPRCCLLPHAALPRSLEGSRAGLRVPRARLQKKGEILNREEKDPG